MEQEPTAKVPSRAPRDDIEKDVGLVAPAGSALASPPAHVQIYNWYPVNKAGYVLVLVWQS